MPKPACGIKAQARAVASNDGSKTFKGEMMKKLCLRILVALVGFAGLGVAAKAQVVDQIVMTVPFEFVAAGKTLPAGTYTVRRVFDSNERALIISSYENNASAIILPGEVESAPTDKPEVSFETAGDEHFLSKIETADHVFTIPVSRAAILLASGKSHTGAVSGSSGAND
jgi:hypothetical protein